MSMFDDLKDVRKAISEFQFAKDVFSKLTHAEVVNALGDDKKISAVQAAQDLYKVAVEHHAAAEKAVELLLSGKGIPGEVERLKAELSDHSSVMGKFLTEAESLAGVEFALVREAIVAHAAK